MQEIEFVTKLKEKSIEINDKQLAQFASYYDLLIEYNQKTNLTAITEKKDVYSKHFFDSLLILSDCNLYGAVADVGTGAGFPGIPLKIMVPDINLTLIEPTRKKLDFLRIVVKELKLKNVDFINQRAEDLTKNRRECFDYVVSRAVAHLNILSELCLPFVKLEGEFWALKGPNADNEISTSQKAIRILGGQLIAVHKHNYQDQSRSNIQIKKIKETPSQYPRNYGKIKNKPLG